MCLLCVCVWNVRLLMMLSLGKGTAGGRIIATLTQTHQSGICSHMWCDPPFPPEFNVEGAHCDSASFVETVMLTPPHPDGINYCNVLKQPTCCSRINFELQGCGEQMSVGICLVLIGSCCMHRCNECSAHRRIFVFLRVFLGSLGIVVNHEFKNCIVVIHQLS